MMSRDIEEAIAIRTHVLSQNTALGRQEMNMWNTYELPVGGDRGEVYLGNQNPPVRNTLFQRTHLV